MNNVVLVTSSDGKIKEYARFFKKLPGVQLNVVKDIDIPEVWAPATIVALYKVKYIAEIKALRKMNCPIWCEDSILEKWNGAAKKWEEIIDIKWRDPEDGPTRFKTTIGEYYDGFCNLYQAHVDGMIDNSKRKPNIHAFSFDDIFIPNGSSLTYHQLGVGKDKFNPKLMAFNMWRKKQYTEHIPYSDIPTWTGKYQKAL